MREWSFLTNHARALLLVAQEPSTRLRDIASALDVTERTAYDLMTDLTDAGYLVKEKDGRRNRYHLQAHLPLRETIGRERRIGEIVDLFVDKPPKRSPRRPSS
jgi:DNA-binding IclR family transcriptional regulator